MNRAYLNLTFEDATRILYYHFGHNKALFTEFMGDLLMNSDSPANMIAPKWYDSYKEHLKENKKQ